jgi:hypothetical protein
MIGTKTVVEAVISPPPSATLWRRHVFTSYRIRSPRPR